MSEDKKYNLVVTTELLLLVYTKVTYTELGLVALSCNPAT